MSTRLLNVKRFLLMISIGIVFLVGSIFLIQFLLQQFQIKKIIVSGDAALVQINEKKFIGNTLLFPTKNILKQILDEYPLVKSIVIKKHLPSTLELIIYKRKPIARLQTASALVGIDEDSVITDVIGDTNFPVIDIDVPLVRMGQQIRDEFVKQAVSFIYGSAPFVTVYIISKHDSSSLRIKTKESDIFITQKGDIRLILDTLQTLMSGFRIKGLIPKTIDLRFDKPVVQF